MFVADLGQKHGNGNLHRRVDRNKCQIIQHGISGNESGLSWFKEELEVIKSVPRASPDTSCVGVFFECHYNSCHRVVGKNQGINYCRCKHQKKYPVLVELFAKPFPTILFHLLIPFLVCATFLLLNSLFFFVPLSYHFGILFTIRSFYKIFLVEIYCFTIFCAKCATLAFYLVAHWFFHYRLRFSRSLLIFRIFSCVFCQIFCKITSSIPKIPL